MTKTRNKLTKAEKQELIKNQVNTLIRNTMNELHNCENPYDLYSDQYVHLYIDELSYYTKLARLLLDSPHKEKVLRNFSAELNMILIDLEDNKKGLVKLYEELTNVQTAIKTAFWAVNYKNEIDPILSNPQSTIQQVLDIHNKHQKLYPHWSDDYTVGDSHISLSLRDYERPKISVWNDWVTEEEEEEEESN